RGPQPRGSCGPAARRRFAGLSLGVAQQRQSVPASRQAGRQGWSHPWALSDPKAHFTALPCGTGVQSLTPRSAAERVAIIGGGVTGALTAARLAERGFDVVLLEKAAIGNGSSSRSMAGIRAQFGGQQTVIGML